LKCHLQDENVNEIFAKPVLQALEERFRNYLDTSMKEFDPVPVSRNRVSVLKLSGGMNKFIPPDGIYRYRVSGGINHFYPPSCKIIPRGIKIFWYKVILKMRINDKSML